MKSHLHGGHTPNGVPPRAVGMAFNVQKVYSPSNLPALLHGGFVHHSFINHPASIDAIPNPLAINIKSRYPVPLPAPGRWIKR